MTQSRSWSPTPDSARPLGFKLAPASQQHRGPLDLFGFHRISERCLGRPIGRRPGRPKSALFAALSSPIIFMCTSQRSLHTLVSPKYWARTSASGITANRLYYVMHV